MLNAFEGFGQGSMLQVTSVTAQHPARDHGQLWDSSVPWRITYKHPRRARHTSPCSPILPGQGHYTEQNMPINDGEEGILLAKSLFFFFFCKSRTGFLNTHSGSSAFTHSNGKPIERERQIMWTALVVPQKKLPTKLCEVSLDEHRIVWLF